MVGGLPGWSYAPNDHNNVVVFVVADGGRQWEGKDGSAWW